MGKIYISGKITGDENYKAKFADSEWRLVKSGWKSIVNPARLSPCNTWENYMLRDIKLLFTCTAIYMLKDWKESKGARIEHAIALNINLLIIYQE